MILLDESWAGNAGADNGVSLPSDSEVLLRIHEAIQDAQSSTGRAQREARLELHELQKEHGLDIDIEPLRIAVEEALNGRPGGTSPIAAVPFQELLGREFSPRSWLIRGLLQERDLGMVHAFRGVGKTRFAHALGCSLSCGADFLRYEIQEPRGVLYVDGELLREELQQLHIETVAAVHASPKAPFNVLSSDLHEDPLPSLSRRAGQEIVEANLNGVDLVILDSISTLYHAEAGENEAESWTAMQAWLLSLRRQGVAVLLVHHDGKGGTQRGTSKREDVLSQVVQLRRPADYSPGLGARFEVHLTKGRAVHGDDAEPFEAELTTGDDGVPTWTWRPLEDSIRRQVLAIYRSGVTKRREIAEEIGVAVSTVQRKINELKADEEIVE